jgi:hypothetical protein
MEPADKRRVLVSIAALLAVPSYYYCYPEHTYIYGHLELPWYGLVSDAA